MKNIMVLFLVLVLFGVWSMDAGAHARWTLNGTAPPRNNDVGLKTPNCGGIARTSTPKIFTPGQTITVQWEETINHPGQYEIYFSKNGLTNFTLMKTIVDTQDTAVVGTNYHQYNTQITLPNEPCNDCVLQLIQVMTENPANPSYYYSCADIVMNTTGLLPTPTPAPTPVPTPAATPVCK